MDFRCRKLSSHPSYRGTAFVAPQVLIDVNHCMFLSFSIQDINIDNHLSLAMDIMKVGAIMHPRKG